MPCGVCQKCTILELRGVFKHKKYFLRYAIRKYAYPFEDDIHNFYRLFVYLKSRIKTLKDFIRSSWGAVWLTITSKSPFAVNNYTPWYRFLIRLNAIIKNPSWFSNAREVFQPFAKQKLGVDGNEVTFVILLPIKSQPWKHIPQSETLKISKISGRGN